MNLLRCTGLVRHDNEAHLFADWRMWRWEGFQNCCRCAYRYLPDLAGVGSVLSNGMGVHPAVRDVSGVHLRLPLGETSGVRDASVHFVHATNGGNQFSRARLCALVRCKHRNCFCCGCLVDGLDSAEVKKQNALDVRFPLCPGVVLANHCCHAYANIFACAASKTVPEHCGHAATRAGF